MYRYIYIRFIFEAHDDALFEKKDKLPFFFYLELAFGNVVASRIGICILLSLPRKESGERKFKSELACLLEEFLFRGEAFSPRYRRCSVMVYCISIVSRTIKCEIFPLNILVVKPDRMVAVS